MMVTAFPSWLDEGWGDNISVNRNHRSAEPRRQTPGGQARLDGGLLGAPPLGKRVDAAPRLARSVRRVASPIERR
jgi:hypothetical protein